jgi:hypothetical protein
MKLSFPVPSTTNVALPLSPSALNAHNPLSRVGTRGEKGDEENRPAPSLGTSAISIGHQGLNGATSAAPSAETGGEARGAVGFAAATISAAQTLFPSFAGTSPDTSQLGRQESRSPTMPVRLEGSPEMEVPEIADEEDEYEDEEDDDDEEEDEDDLQPTSQYISALDLAGY